MSTDDAADIRFDAASENCIFYISRMDEFSHSLSSGPSEFGSAARPKGYAPPPVPTKKANQRATVSLKCHKFFCAYVMEL